MYHTHYFTKIMNKSASNKKAHGNYKLKATMKCETKETSLLVLIGSVWNDLSEF